MAHLAHMWRTQTKIFWRDQNILYRIEKIIFSKNSTGGALSLPDKIINNVGTTATVIYREKEKPLAVNLGEREARQTESSWKEN